MPGNSNISAGNLPHEQLYWGTYLIDEGKTTASTTSLRKKTPNPIFQGEHTRGENITALLGIWSVNKSSQHSVKGTNPRKATYSREKPQKVPEEKDTIKCQEI